MTADTDPAARAALREQLAALAHKLWSGWMVYMFSKGYFRVLDLDELTQTAFVLPAELRSRWERQMRTAYADLPEGEKESDRQEADKMIAAYAPLLRRAAEALVGLKDGLDEYWITLPEGSAAVASAARTLAELRAALRE